MPRPICFPHRFVGVLSTPILLIKRGHDNDGHDDTSNEEERRVGLKNLQLLLRIRRVDIVE